MIVHVRRLLPFSGPQIFDLVADVERYPEFLPWCTSARIIDRGPGWLKVDQELGVGKLTVRFLSNAVLHRPDRLDVTSSDHLFQEFHLGFSFGSRDPTACTLQLEACVTPASLLLAVVVDRTLAGSVDAMLEAFHSRARRVYGSPEGMRP